MRFLDLFAAFGLILLALLFSGCGNSPLPPEVYHGPILDPLPTPSPSPSPRACIQICDNVTECIVSGYVVFIYIHPNGTFSSCIPNGWRTCPTHI